MTTEEVQRELCRREWAERIAECESGNMSVREWRAENGMNHIFRFKSAIGTLFTLYTKIQPKVNGTLKNIEKNSD
jgi:hypothetical protein